MSRFRDRYGASPLHALAHLAAFAVAGFVVLQFLDLRATANVLIWFVAAVVLHDFILLPFYSGLDRAAQAIGGRRRRSTTCASRSGSRGCCCSSSSR